jgi:Na+-driven multidrug efflux pump
MSSSSTAATVMQEAGVIAKLAWPSCIGNLTFLTGMSVVFLVGQYGTDAIAGAGLGVMWLNVSGTSILVGTGSGLGSLSSQAFGAKNYRRVGLLLQRQFAYQLLLCIPIGEPSLSLFVCSSLLAVCKSDILTARARDDAGLCWYNTEAILLAASQPPRVSYFAGLYVRRMLFGLPAIPFVQNLNSFLMSQRIPRPTMVCSLFSNLCVALPLAWYLSQPEVLGFEGAPTGVVAGQICQACLMRIVAPRMITEKTWLPLQMEALDPRGWVELLRLGIGAAVGWWAEWWSNEIMIFMCVSITILLACWAQVSNLKELQFRSLLHARRCGIICSRRDSDAGGESGPCAEIAVTVLLRNAGMASFFLSMGFGQATPVRVGNLLGAGDPKTARIAAYTGSVMQTVSLFIHGSTMSCNELVSCCCSHV